MKKIIALAVVATTCTTSVFAQSGLTETGLNYNEVGVSYQSIKFNGDNASTLTGYGLGGSYLLNSNFYLLGSTGSATKTIDGVKNQFSPTQVGLGYRLGVGKNVDGYANLNYASVGFKTDTSSTKTGYSFAAGVRALVAPGVDMSAAVMTQKLSESDAQNGYSIGLGYELSPSVVGRISYLAFKDVAMTTVGLGYKF